MAPSPATPHCQGDEGARVDEDEDRGGPSGMERGRQVSRGKRSLRLRPRRRLQSGSSSCRSRLLLLNKEPTRGLGRRAPSSVAGEKNVDGRRRRGGESLRGHAATRRVRERMEAEPRQIFIIKLSTARVAQSTVLRLTGML